jgi:hypothetical protein
MAKYIFPGLLGIIGLGCFGLIEFAFIESLFLATSKVESLGIAVVAFLFNTNLLALLFMMWAEIGGDKDYHVLKDCLIRGGRP